MVKSFTEELNEELKKRTETDEEKLGKLHAEAEVPHPLMLDEVSASFISWLRVQSWEDLGTDFGGYKIGRILAYILDVLNEKIEDSTAATIKVDVPLYEQCPKIACNWSAGADTPIQFENGFSQSKYKFLEGEICRKNDLFEAISTLTGFYFEGRDFERFTNLLKARLDNINELAIEGKKDRREIIKNSFEEMRKNLREIKNLICNPAGARTEMELMKNQHERLNKIYKLACEGLGEEVPECQ